VSRPLSSTRRRRRKKRRRRGGDEAGRDLCRLIALAICALLIDLCAIFAY
jgi:hypothetical protein